VTCNVAPELCAAFYNDCMSGQWQGALYGQDRLIRLHKALFADASPSPTKFALAHLGLCREEARLPIVACSQNARAEVLAGLREAGLI
jgi:4-hydroxy-tetrahydrodipicolinate synthase